MPRPPTTLLEAKFPCAASVDNASAIKACELAAGLCGYHVASRTGRSVLLMPGPRRALFSCMAPGRSAGGPPSRAGSGITAELVPDEYGDGFAIAVATSRATKGEAFISALASKLEELHCTPSVEEQNYGASRFKKEAQAYYFFSKILYDARQAPGMAVVEFVDSFVDSCETMSPTVVGQGQPMAECNTAVDRISNVLQEHLMEPVDASAARMNHKMLSELQPWLKPSVERFIFTHVGAPIWRLYEDRFSAEDSIFLEKARILRVASDAAVMAALEIKQEFRGSTAPSSSSRRRLRLPTGGLDCRGKVDVGAEACGELLRTPSTRADTEDTTSEQAPTTFSGGSADRVLDRSLSSLSRDSAYHRAAAALSQLEAAVGAGRSCMPREALEVLTSSQLEMKTCALEISEGQSELCSMDDILPIFIFVLIRSSLSRPLACARFIGDALSQDERLGSKGRAVLLLESAGRHVAFDWDITGFATTSSSTSAADSRITAAAGVPDLPSGPSSPSCRGEIHL